MKGKRVISLFLAVVLVLGMVSLSPPSAYAAPTTDGFGFDTSPPSDFNANDGENPYGQGRVALNAKREIMVMGDNITPAVYDVNNPNGDKAAVTSLPDVIKANQNMRYKLLAFDPNGSGKDDHVACIAVEDISGYYAVRLWVLNAKTGKLVGSKITLKDGNAYPGVGLEAVDLLSIAAGDMDGDNKDELYAFVPGDNTNSGTTNGKIVKINDSWNGYTEFITLDTRAAGGAAVPLAMGDADGDGKDELAYTLFKKASYPNNHELSVILKGENGIEEEWNTTITWSTRPLSTPRKAYPASLAFGNLNGDNKEDLVVAYQGESSLRVCAYQFRQNRGEPLSAEEKQAYSIDGSSASSVPVVLCFAARGMGQPDYIFVNGSVLNENLGNYISETSHQVISAVAGNFDGNDEGRENVLYSYNYRYSSTNRGCRVALAMDTDYKTVWGRLLAANFPGTLFSSYNYYMALAAPDVDDDTVFIEYRSKEYTFDNPKIISILQAAPYFEDLGDYYYDATGGTSFGTSSGSGGGSSQSTSVNAHATLKVGAEFGFIVTVAAYVETTASTEWSSEYSVMETTTLETKFNGGKQENNVVLLGIPVTMYTYDVYGPNGKGGYDKDQMVISIPGDPQYSVITVEQYNAAARAGGLAPISDSQVHATPGDPASYYQEGSGELNGLKNLVTYNGDYISVGGSGTATTTRSITKETEESITDTFTYDIDINTGMEAAGSGGSIGGGFGESNSSVQVTTSGVTREVEVANVPAEGQGLYGFQWNMAIWDTQVGKQTVPVVGYVTRNVKQPPALPGAFTVTETSSNSVTLGWEESATASSYQIYQYFADSSIAQYSLVATLDADETNYTISDLSPASRYEYVICSLDAKGERSVYSSPLTAVTLPEGGQSPRITKNPEETVNARPGGTATFQISAQPAAGTSGLTYTWYESAKGGSVWNQVGGSSSTLSLSDVTTKMDGNRYRCVVSQTIGGKQVLVYSGVAELKVGQGATATTLTMSRNSGKAGYSKETTTKETVTVPKSREITVGGYTASYVEHNASGGTPDVKNIYRTNDGRYYVLEGVSLNGDGKTGTATKATPLSQKPSEFTAESGEVPEGVTPGSLTGSERGVFTIPAGSAASGTTAGDYYVYTARIGTGENARSETVYAKEETNPSTCYTLSQEIVGDGDNAKPIYTMTAVTSPTNVQPVMVAGTLIVKGENGVGDVVQSIPENPGTDTYTTYAVYDAGKSGTKVYQANGKYYLLTVSDNSVDDRTELTVKSYDTLESKDQMYTDITPGEAVTETVTKETIVMTPVGGDPVTLTAAVQENNSSAIPDGTVTFRITNTDTGTSRNQTVTLQGGKATLTWTPDTAGVYSITATYNGNANFLTSTSTGGTYYATADGKNEFDNLVLRPDKTSVEYGDTVSLTLYEAKTENGSVTEKPSTPTGVTYTLRWKNPDYKPNTEGSEEYLEQSLGTSPTWTAIKTPGSYSFTAKTSSGKTASTAVTVTKRALDVKVEDKEVAMGTVPTAKDLTFTRSGTEDTSVWVDKDDYANLFDVSTTLTASSGSGVYPVTPVMVKSNEERLNAFNSCYTWTPVSGQWTVKANTHTVTLTAGVNGAVTGYVGDNWAALGSSAPHGAKLHFRATPDTGFQVAVWKLNGKPVTTTATTGVSLSEDRSVLTVNSLTENLNVEVTFSNQSYQINFGVDTTTKGGTVTAKNVGQPIAPGTPITGGSSVTFTAEPDQGKIVKSWTVNNQVKENEDGSNYVGNTLTLENISAITNVVVAFEDAESYTVTFTAVNPEYQPVQAGTVTLRTEGLDGKNQAVKGSRVVLTAAPGPGSGVQEWQEQEGSTWKTIAPSQTSFAIENLQSDRTIRVVVQESVTTHTLTFNVVDEQGKTVADGGMLKTVISDQEVTSGGNYVTSSKVDFAFSEVDAYEVVSWTVNGAEVQSGHDKLDYTINNLLEDTTVNVVVKKKPLVTVNSVEHGTVEVAYQLDGKTVTPKNGYVYAGTDVTVTLKPDIGYEVANSENMSAVVNSDDRYYTIHDVTEDQTITPAWAEIPQVPITFSVIDKTPGQDGGVDGTITAVVSRKGLPGYEKSVETTGAEEQSIQVYRDSVVTFVSNPDSGYTIGERFLDNVSQHAQIILNITAQHEDHNVQVRFDPVGTNITYGFDRSDATDLAAMSAKFTATGGSGAEDFKSGSYAEANGRITFTVSDLNSEYQIEGWYVNDVKQEGETGLTYTMTVTQKVGATVRVKLVPKQYSVTFSADQGSVTAKAEEFESSAGEITIGSGRKLNSGSRVTFTAPSVTGYTFQGWTVNGQASGEKSQTLTIDPLRQDTEVKANYEMIIVNYQVDYGVQGGGGNLTASAGGESLTNPASVRSGSRVVFTAVPSSGYQVDGWYRDSNCTEKIAGTSDEQKTYTISSLTGDTSVYVRFKQVPTYDITVTIAGTRQGTVTAAVNGQAAALTDGRLTVNHHDEVVLTASPSANQYLTAWTLDGENKGNGSMTLRLDDVTASHAVTAEFGSTQSADLTVKVEGGNGGLTTKVGYSGDMKVVDATTSYRADVGQTVEVTAQPNADYMVKCWKIDGEIQKNLSNTLVLEKLTKTTVITVEYEELKLFDIAALTSDSAGTYIITNVTRTPTDYGSETQIRAGGSVSFTVKPAEGKYLTELKINGKDFLNESSSNGDGSYTVTIENVQEDISLTANSLAFQTVTEALTTVPQALQGKFQTADALHNELRTQIKQADSQATDDQTALLDIKLQYTENGTDWMDATPEHFPKGGIQVSIPYSALGDTDSSYTFTVIHMFTADMNGHTIGGTERITPTKDNSGLHFTVTSLSPFAIGWTKPAAPVEPEKPVDPNPDGGSSGGGGGGGIVASGFDIIVDTDQNGTVTPSRKNAAKGDTVTLTAVPKEGYVLASLTITDAKGGTVKFTEQDGTYRFTMPASKVTVKAVFAESGKPSGNPFVDVKEDDFFWDAVQWAVENGITSGTTDVTFSPSSSCTRAQIVTFLWRSAGSPEPQSSTMPFADVDAGSYYEKAVQWAVEQEITTGTSAAAFSPDMTCTRGQSVTFLYRAAGSPQISGGVSFSDVEPGDYYADAVSWAEGAGVASGIGGGRFGPASDCTRAQIVTFLYRWQTK